MEWEKVEGDRYDCYGPADYLPEIPPDREGDGDENHATGHLEGPEKLVCDICQKTGVCVYYNNHRFCDTDDIDLMLCGECLKMGLKIIKDKT